MISKGAVKEVKKLLKIRDVKSKSAFKAIGIKEVGDYLSKKIKIDELIDKISIKTRQYAKRQSTWARGNMLDWHRVNQNDLKKFLKKI